eukprot:6438903-Pyramimonas_sp.AAC.1
MGFDKSAELANPISLPYVITIHTSKEGSCIPCDYRQVLLNLPRTFNDNVCAAARGGRRRRAVLKSLPETASEGGGAWGGISSIGKPRCGNIVIFNRTWCAYFLLLVGAVDRGRQVLDLLLCEAEAAQLLSASLDHHLRFSP